MKTLYFGLTANPIHFGHLLMIESAIESGGYDRGVLIPCYSVTDKSADKIPSFQHRFEMARIATAWHNSPISVSDIEYQLFLQTGLPSYTINTVCELKRRGEEQVEWLIGSDRIQSLHRWHKAEELVKLVKFRVVYRSGGMYPMTPPPETLALLKSSGLGGEYIQAPNIEMSSSAIRKRVADGKSIKYYVPRGVEEYIYQNHLYR